MTEKKTLALPTGAIYTMTNIVRSREKHLASALSLLGMTLAEWRVLRIIRSFAEPVGMSVLMAYSQTDRTALGRTVDRLVTRGFVERLPDPHDKRAFLLRRLDSRADVFDEAYAVAERYDTSLVAGLSAQEHEILLRVLSSIEQKMR